MALWSQKVCLEEIERYLKSPRLALQQAIVGPDGTAKKEFNSPLLWWKENQNKYPVLAKLARMYLAIPATSTPSERVFSVASKVISKFRNRLDPAMAGKVLYVSENYEWFMKKREIEKDE